jgi:2Fe-2S ferredoxin
VRDEFLAEVGPALDLEDDLLDLAVEDRRPGSRLSCQIEVTESRDGLTVDVPQNQV